MAAQELQICNGTLTEKFENPQTSFVKLCKNFCLYLQKSETKFFFFRDIFSKRKSIDFSKFVKRLKEKPPMCIMFLWKIS